jgi:hypothetical protein
MLSRPDRESFDEIAPRIQTEALPRITEEDFRREDVALLVRARAAFNAQP